MKKSFRIIKFKKNKPVLQVRGVSKSFAGRPVLKKINLELYPGEIIGLVGPNGSGKSTLYGTIIGQYKVDAGSISLSQKDITEKPIHERARLGINYLSQYRNVFKPFVRLDKSRSLNKSGVGLGLAIVEDVINSHGGNIQLSTSKYKGLQVKISLPF